MRLSSNFFKRNKNFFSECQMASYFLSLETFLNEKISWMYNRCFGEGFKNMGQWQRRNGIITIYRDNTAQNNLKNSVTAISAKTSPHFMNLRRYWDRQGIFNLYWTFLISLSRIRQFQIQLWRVLIDEEFQIHLFYNICDVVF